MVVDNDVIYTVSSILYAAFHDCNGLTSVTIPNSVTTIGISAFSGCSDLTSVTIPNSVTTIDNYAFDGCSSLTSLTIPKSVTMVGISAFRNCTSLIILNFNAENCVCMGLDGSHRALYGCSALTTINIGENVKAIPHYAFNSCDKITTINIPDSVTWIGYEAFEYCSSLSSINIPNSVTSIDSYTFNGCSSLTSVKLGDSLSTIGNSAFSECRKLTEINLPETLISIGKEAFYNCSSLTSINLPNSVKSIGGSAFKNCSSLSAITIPNSVTTINYSTFESCTNLKTAELHDGITSIGHYAFRDCSSLTDIQLPSQLITIESYSFYNCSSLTSITIPNSVTTIKGDAFSMTGITSIILPESVKNMGSYIFSDCDKLKTAILPGSLSTLPYGIFYRCTALSEVVIPESVTTIEYGAFSGCSSLTEIELPQQLKSIGESAFYGTGLTTIEIPSSVTTIGKSAFRASSLKSIVIPETVTSVGDYAFAECSSLKDVTLSKGITTISQYMFQKCTALENITIPNSVTEIAPYAFDNCTKLKDVKLSENLKTIWYGAFGYCSALEEIVIPKSVTTLADANEYTSGAYVGFNHSGVFQECRKLKKVVFENESSLNIIGSRAFINCESLGEIKIPENVSRIGYMVFYGCKYLSGLLELPSTITSLANSCYWTNYKTCKLKAVSPPELTDTTNCLGGNISMIIVPNGSGASYKAAAGWKNYTIVEEGGSDVEVTVTTPGYMAVDIMEQAGVAPAKVTTLKVHGRINQTDFNVMKSNMLNCYSIDLSDAECDSIPDDAFNGKTYLVGFKLPQSCKYIGKNAFKDCSIGEITLSNRVETISSYAFYGNNIGGDIVFPTTVKTLGERFISKNSRITSIDLSECKDLNAIPKNAFTENIMLKEVTLPNSITMIGSGAFETCASMEEFTMPSSLTDIYGYAFNGCSNLKSMDFSLAINLTTIHQYAFLNCTSLKEFAINGLSSLNSIGDYAFQQCTALEYVALPGLLQTLGNYAFHKCGALKKVDFIPFYYTEPKPLSDSDIKQIVNLETIGKASFELCTSLESISLPSGVKTIGTYAFNACYALKYADFSKCKSLTTLPQCAFNDNTSLEVVNLPASLTTVNNSTFKNCTKLQNISVAAVTPPTVANANAFTGVDTENCVLSVPTSSYVDYIVSEHWGAFVSLCKGIIVEKDDNVDVYFRHLIAEDLELQNNAQQLANVKTASINDDSETVEYGALVVDGSSVYAKNNGYIKFILDVVDGYVINQVLYNDEDVTAQVVNNTYTTPAVTVKGTLKVVTGFPAGIEDIKTGDDTDAESVEVARYDVNGRLLSTPVKGINIIKMSDGNTRKEFVK